VALSDNERRHFAPFAIPKAFKVEVVYRDTERTRIIHARSFSTHEEANLYGFQLFMGCN
jgi:hypothetical protein